MMHCGRPTSSPSSKLARQNQAEVSYGLIHSCEPDTDGKTLGVFPPELGQWGLQAALLHSGLGYLPLEPSDWVFGIPSDWSLAERMLRIGVRFAMLEESVVDVYPHHLWGERDKRRSPQASAGDASLPLQRVNAFMAGARGAGTGRRAGGA